jgi:hypothetical protein
MGWNELSMCQQRKSTSRSGSNGIPAATGLHGVTDPFLQPLHLIVLPKADKFAGHGSLKTTEHSPEIPRQHQQAPNDIWLTFHLISAAKNLKRRMATEEIILLAPVQQSPEDPFMIRTSHIAVVHANPFVKSPSLPAFRLRAE